MRKINVAKLIKQLVFWLLMIVVMFLSLEFIGLNIAHRSAKTIILLFLIIFGSVAVHLHYGQQKSNYIKNNVLTFKANMNRSYKYDYLRILAASFVIITHIVQNDVSKGYIIGENQLFISKIIYTLTLSCNLIYVMLSGALLLPYKEESLFDFYTKRVSKVGIPLVIYYVFYLWQNLQLTNITPSLLKNICYNLITGKTPESPHYWLIYTILSIYIVIPFFRYMFKNLSYKMLTALCIIILLFMTLNTFSGIGLAIGTFISSWIGVAVIGYWVTRQETRKYDIILILVGIITVIVAIYIIKTQSNFLSLICNCSPVMTLISAGIFALVFKFGKLFDKGNWVIRILSKYSYSIILIHWWSLHWIAVKELGIRIDMYGGIGIIICYLAVLVVSLLMGFLIDNLVVVLVDYTFNWIIKMIKKLVLLFVVKRKQCLSKE